MEALATLVSLHSYLRILEMGVSVCEYALAVSLDVSRTCQSPAWITSEEYLEIRHYQKPERPELERIYGPGRVDHSVDITSQCLTPQISLRYRRSRMLHRMELDATTSLSD